MTEEYIIELREVKIGYGERVLFSNSNLRLKRGEFISLIGRNGTGKSTLLRSIAGLSKIQRGEILIQGSPISMMSPRQISETISFVSTEEVRIANLMVEDVVALGRAPYTNWIGRLGDDDHQIIDESLRMVGMYSFKSKAMDQLSDGERQRVMIARALAQDTPIILLDEPTAFLDLPNKYDACLLLRRLAYESGKCILFSTHDLEISLQLCDTIAMINENKVYYGSASQLIKEGVIDKIFENSSIFFDSDNNSIGLKIK